MYLTKNEKHYYPFIDVAKGLGVFCVLMVHTLRFWVDLIDDFTTLVIKTFYMGLLFMASGFVFAKIWNRNIKISELYSFKTCNILVPFFVLGITSILLTDYYSTGTISRNPLERLFFEVFNGGYWFLLTLFLCRWITLFTKYISQKILIVQNTRSLSFVLTQILGCALVGGVIVCISDIYKLEIQLFNLTYFVLGILIFTYDCNRVFCRKYIFTTIITFFIALFTFNYVSDYHYFGRTVFVGIFSTLSVWILLLRTGNNKIVTFFKWIGGFSLDIYVLHSLFLIGTVGWINSNWFQSLPWIFQTFVLVIGAIVQLIPCYFLSRIIRSDSILTKIILGR